jgi:ABC-type glycerol-3-phosphate transport system substrate-binding protein
LAPGIADFERQNPGVKVISEIGPQSSTQLHDLLTQKLKNRDPRLDVFVMDVIWPAEFAFRRLGFAAGPLLL